MSQILVTGSLHYDIMLQADHRPEKGETVIGSRCSYKFGGKGGNQAVAAARAGAAVRFAGAVGDDAPGAFLLAVLDEHGIDSRVAVKAGEPSGMSVAIQDAEGDYGAVVVSGANTLIEPQALAEASLWQQVGMLVLQNEVTDAVNLAAAQAARQRAIPVCINAAPARPLSPALIACLDLLVVNGVEARDMSGISVNSLADALLAAQALGQHYPAVVVTAGEHGVAWVEAGQPAQSLAAQKVALVSTHGAGDCFMGMLCATLLQGEPLSTAVARANQAAAEHVSRPAA
ncbi:PfkB family carbohydrate kinase [Erwinia sp. B116]|uniref:PfkB family carbohydrate kinase n=1 Tax=Erwinia sp. B116 TaxID=1561024 RepID=UPI000C776DEF|nr:PfkB family carbohydrate kinase [Erwinia sp. B116]PLV61340.1 carbohydrate kinase [Erwinia sp. B116]